MPRSRASWRWASAGLLLAVSCSAQSNFDFYPEASRACLERITASSNCESNNVPETNACFCSNGGNWIIDVASCVGEEAKDDVQDVYATMQEACSNSDTPMSVSQSDFFAAADGEEVASTTTTTRRPTGTQADPESTQTDNTSTEADSTSTETEATSTGTTSQEPTTTNTENTGSDGADDSGGLSQGATIGIGVGAGVVGLALIGAAVVFFLRRRNRQTEESNPMLPDYRHHAPTTFPPSEPSPAYGGYTDAKSSPSVSPYSNATHSGVWQPPPAFQGQQTPQSYPQQPYNVVSAQEQHYAGYPLQTNGPAEIDGVQMHVAEMPGSTPQYSRRL